jgi:uncharacterized membrane protein YfcA
MVFSEFPAGAGQEIGYFVDRPWPVLIVLIITLWLSAWIGARVAVAAAGSRRFRLL